MTKLAEYARLIKFEHTIFALPFALASVLILYERAPTLWQIFWIVVALVSARTLGMALNRLLDEDIDRLNPRTKDWSLPAGRVTREEVKRLIYFSGAVFVFSTLMLNFLAFLLSPVVIFLLWIYPKAKRFTNYPHVFLGLVYLLIPVAVDVALNERVSTQALLLGFAMATWVAGFDILYSIQDYEFDRKHGIGSLPAKHGIETALKVSRLLHLATFLFLVFLGIASDRLGFIYFAGLVVLGAFLVYEHSLVKPWDLSKLNKAFFTVNGYVSIAFFLVVLLDKVL